MGVLFVLRGLMPRGLMPRGLMPRGLMPRGLIPRGLIPRGLVPRGLMPRGLVLKGKMRRNKLKEFSYLLRGLSILFCFSLFPFQSHSDVDGEFKSLASVGSLTCRSIHAIETSFLNTHIMYNRWTPELRSRVASNFSRFLDKNKIYLLKDDVKYIEGRIADFIDKSIRNGPSVDGCEDIREAFNLFVTRVHERFIVISDYLKSDRIVLNGGIVSVPGDDINLENVRDINSFTEYFIKSEMDQYMFEFGVSIDVARSYMLRSYERFRDAESETWLSKDKYKLWLRYLKAFTYGLDPHSVFLSDLEVELYLGGSKDVLTGIGIDINYSVDGKFAEIFRLIPGGRGFRVW